MIPHWYRYLLSIMNLFFSCMNRVSVSLFLWYCTIIIGLGWSALGFLGQAKADLAGFRYGMDQVENQLQLRSFLPTQLEYVFKHQFPEYLSNTYFLLSQHRDYAYAQVDYQSQFSSPELVKALRWDIETLNDTGVWKFLEGSPKRAQKLDEYQFLAKEVLIVSTEQYDTLVQNEKNTQSRINTLQKEYKTLQENFSTQVMSSSFQELKPLRNEIQNTALHLSQSQTELIEIQKNKSFFESQIPLLQNELEYSQQYQDALIKEVRIENQQKSSQEEKSSCTSALNCLPLSL